MPNIAIYSQKNGDEFEVYLHQFILELEKRENVQIFLHEKIRYRTLRERYSLRIKKDRGFLPDLLIIFRKIT